MGPARIYPWRKMHRSRAPSIAPGTFSVAQSWADSITDMPGFDLRQAHLLSGKAKQGKRHEGSRVNHLAPGHAAKRRRGVATCSAGTGAKKPPLGLVQRRTHDHQKVIPTVRRNDRSGLLCRRSESHTCRLAADNQPAKEQHISQHKQRRYRGYRIADCMSRMDQGDADRQNDRAYNPDPDLQ
jgi:hypothetical protein